MAERVRMKSLSTFDNPLVFNHAKEREGRTSVQPGDEFSTEEEHAVQLEQAKMAERASGDVSDRTEKQAMIKGAQTPSPRPAISANRKAETPVAQAVVAPAADAPPVKPAT